MAKKKTAKKKKMPAKLTIALNPYGDLYFIEKGEDLRDHISSPGESLVGEYELVSQKKVRVEETLVEEEV